MAYATFAAGCFWGVEALFRTVEGVNNTRVGYLGGATHNPAYELVCTGNTGHAEAVEIDFDPSIVSYETLLQLFFENHDPTTVDRQGPDIGTQYRSAIFYHDAAQQAAALDMKEKLEASKHYKRMIVTQIVPATTFYPAEEYHQRYLEKQGLKSCRLDPDAE